MKRAMSFHIVTTFALVLLLALAAPAQSVNCTGVTAWAPNIHVTVGELVTFNGQEFKTLQAHTTLAGWEPPNVPALFTLVGNCGGTATPTPTKPPATPTPTTGPGTPTPTRPPATATPTATATAKPGTGCAAPWNAGTQYCGGAVVSVGGNNYTAQFCSTGANPTTAGNSGPGGTGDPWFPPVACAVTPTPVPPPPTPTPTPCVTNCAASGFIFSPYKDVTVDANFNTGAQQTSAGGTSLPVAQAMPNKTLTWAFATGDCTAESWAGISPAMEATNVQAFVSNGKDYILSTGGAAGSFSCSSASGLVGFINRYNSSNLVGVDFDIETGQSAAAIQSLVSSVKGAMSTFPNLRFSFTVAAFGSTAAPDIFNSTGDAVINAIKSTGLTGNWTINPMSFDFGGASSSVCVVVNGACEMGQSAVATIQAVSTQKGVAMGHIEVTLEVPTDDGGVPFTSTDVNTVCSFARSNGVAGIHFWSLDRDTGFTFARSIPSACGTN